MRLWQRLTEPRVEHVERHLIALRGSRDSDQSLIAIILRFIYLDHAATELPDLVDLCATFPNDSADHVVGNEDLLSQRLTWYHALNGLRWWSSMAMGWLMGRVLWRLMRSSSCITLLRRTAIVYGRLRLLLGRLTMKIWHAIRIRRCTLRLVIVSSIVFWMTILASGGLRHVRNHLHTAGNDTGRSPTSSSVRRSCWTTKALGQLLYKRLSNVVRSNMHSICDTKNDERSFCGERQARVGRVETGARCFLNLANAYA